MSCQGVHGDVHTAQLEDTDIMPALQAKQAGQRPGGDELKGMSLPSRRLVQLWEQLVIQDSILYRWFEDPSGREAKLQLVVPGTLRDEVLQYYLISHSRVYLS